MAFLYIRWLDREKIIITNFIDLGQLSRSPLKKNQVIFRSRNVISRTAIDNKQFKT